MPPPSSSSLLCAPTVRGEIKKARASNYDIYSALNEFIDNSLDAGSENILLDIRERVDSNERWIHKILISDDSKQGISKTDLREIFSWTFERERQQQEIGEFGTGFKSASVNLSDKLTILTFSGKHGCMEAIADWHEMSEDNVWVPKILSVDKSFMRAYHPFETGTTMMLENIRHDFIQQCGQQLMSRVLEEISHSYKYFLKHHPRVELVLRGTNSNAKPISFSQKNGYMIYYFDHAPLIIESKILVFRDSKLFDVYLQRENTPYWEKISFVEKRKNGNNVLESVHVAPQKGKNLVDTLLFRSCTYYDASCSSPESFGTVDIVRNHRIMAKNISYRSPRSDPHVSFLKHELMYKNKVLNAILGVQFNKSSDGRIPDGEMRHTLEYIQKTHEKELMRFEKTKLGRVVVREKAEDDFLCIDEPIMKQAPDSPVRPTKSPTTTKLENVMVLQEKQPPLELVPSIKLAPPPFPKVEVSSSPIIMANDPAPAAIAAPKPKPVEEKRKNFTMETKMEAIKKQECRDSEFDFRLLDDILPLDYDHKNGKSSNNSQDNCQVLSVISHALKTRRPDVFEKHLSKKHEYIVKLLNCITSSKFFVSAYTTGKITVRKDPDMLTDRNGLFVSSKDT